MSARFEASNLGFRYPGHARAALDAVSLTIYERDFCAIIGPNGSGKSTLLRLLLGVLQPDSGRALYSGQPSAGWNRREMARQVGVVPQIEELFFPFTVRELVAMGRYPHLGAWQLERETDRNAIDRALQRCDVSTLHDRTLQHISGGERQRVRLARALAQEPHTLVLDEPTASLDLGHEMALFELLARLREQDGVTVVAATHNLNLAARFATRVILLADGHAIASGSPSEVLTDDRIADVYGWPVQVHTHPGPGPDQGAPQIVPLRSATFFAPNPREAQ
jgi:iron complex transport system ATP-binding protein